MRSSIYWIEHPKSHRLGIMARPRAGDWLPDEIGAWKADGLATVVSLLENEEVEDLGLSEEPGLCRAAGIEFISFPISDRGVPDASAARDLVASICDIMASGRAVAIHCRAGIGRSALIAGAALVLSGMEPSRALEIIEQARGVQVPDTEAQRDWLFAFQG